MWQRIKQWLSIKLAVFNVWAAGMPRDNEMELNGPIVDRGCEVPPEGWFCTRIPGHTGPCAAIPVTTPHMRNPTAIERDVNRILMANQHHRPFAIDPRTLTRAVADPQAYGDAEWKAAKERAAYDGTIENAIKPADASHLKYSHLSKTTTPFPTLGTDTSPVDLDELTIHPPRRESYVVDEVKGTNPIRRKPL